MSIFDNMYNQKSNNLVVLCAQAIGDERDRIVRDSLASSNAVDLLIKQHVDRMNNIYSLANVSYVYENLKSIILPGDFEKTAMDLEEMSEMSKDKVDVVDATEPSEEDIDEATSKLDEIMQQDAAEDEPEEEIEVVILGRLEEAVYELGRNGKHAAALKIEKMISNITTEFNKGK